MENSKDIEQGNKAIAIFDGYKESDGKLWRNHAWTTVAGLKYHKDWNHLMPIVEKIISESGAYFYSDWNWKIINGNKVKTFRFGIKEAADYLIEDESESLIDAAWKAVIQFIQWLNTKKH